MSPFRLPRGETRSIAFDPCVPLGFPQRASDADIEALWRRRVAEREQRRCEAKEERVLAFLRPQAI